MIGDGAGHRGRAIDAGQNADEVAGGHAAIGAHIAHEGTVLCRCIGFDIGTKRVVALEAAFVGPHVQVVGVHMLAGGDGLRRKADDLVVAAHRFACCNVSHGQLVTGWHQAAHRHILHDGTGDQLLAGDDDIIGGVKANRQTHVEPAQ